MAYRRKRIDSDNLLIFTPHFPYNSGKKSRKHTVWLGIGGNIGDTPRRFERLWWFLKRFAYMEPVETSPILRNPPFGYVEQEDFFNAVMVIETSLTPQALMRALLRIERRFGRRRSFKNAPRTLDLDMLFYENVKLKTKTLTLPHPHWQKRESVTIPLGYLKRRAK